MGHAHLGMTPLREAIAPLPAQDALAIGEATDQNCSDGADSPQRELDDASRAIGPARGPHPVPAFHVTTGGLRKVSTSTAITEAAEQPHGGSPRPAVPFKSPTYPLRTHFRERGELEQQLRSADERIQAVRQKLDVMGNHPDRTVLERLYLQMVGARDQIAEGVRRLPLETGALYDEDHERYAEAVAAFERVHRRWESGGR